MYFYRTMENPNLNDTKFIYSVEEVKTENL